MKILKFLNDKLEEVFLVTVISAMVIIVFAQIMTRYFFKMPLPWSEEVARMMFLWITWVGAAFATKERQHVVIDVVYAQLPKLGKKVCSYISTVIWIVFIAIMVYLSFCLTSSVAESGHVAMGSGIPIWVQYASIPTGLSLMVFRLIQNLMQDIKANGEEETDGCC